MNRTPDTWIADGYEVKQRGGRMIAYFGPHHTPAHEYPLSCKLQDEENARWCAAAPARIAALEDALRFISENGGTTHETECGTISCNGSWCAEQARAALFSLANNGVGHTANHEPS